MKKHKKAIPAAPLRNQLLSFDAMRVSARKEGKFPERAVRILIALCGCIGTPVVMKGFFQLPLDIGKLSLFIIALTLVMRGARLISPKLGFGGILAAFASIPVLLVRYREAAVIGAGKIYHLMRKTILWRSTFPDILPEHSGGWTQAQCVQFVFIMMSIALVALVEYSDVLLTHPHSSKSGFWIRFLVTFPFLECGLYFGLETSSAAVFMLLFFWIGTLLVSRRNAPRRIVTQQAESVVLQTQCDSDAERKFTMHENSALLFLSIFAAIALLAVASTSRYVRSEALNQKRQAIRDWYKNVSIDAIMEALEEIPGSFGPDTVSDEVDLLMNGNLHFDGRPVLHMDIGGAAAPDDYYLRGVVRSEYTGRGWALPYSVYRKHLRLFRKLTTANRMPQTIFHSDHVEELRTADGKFPVVRCNVTAVNDEKVNFLPYQSVFDIGTGYRYDIEVGLDSQKEYSYWLLNNYHIDWAQLTAEEHPSSDPLVTQYEEFVASQYLNIPDTPEMTALREFVSPALPDASLPLDERLLTIRNYLWNNAEYTMQPGTQPQDQDFVTYFLTQSHRGYCAHYASAAVLLCRMCGIPARYCQGYVLTSTNFQGAKNGDIYEVHIPDDQAHAWAEIYVKGYGWIPYEFTENVYEAWHKPAETTPPETTIAILTTTTTAVTQIPVHDATAPVTTNPGMAAMTQMITTSVMNVVPGGHPLSPQVRKVLKTLAILLCASAAIMLYWVLHCLLIERRKREMSDENPNRAAEASYRFIVHLLRIYGIEQKKLSHDTFADNAEEKCRLLKAGKITRAIRIQQEAVFSRSGISQKEAQTISQIAAELANAMYQNAGVLRKLWLRWGRHIVK